MVVSRNKRTNKVPLILGNPHIHTYTPTHKREVTPSRACSVGSISPMVGSKGAKCSGRTAPALGPWV